MNNETFEINLYDMVSDGCCMTFNKEQKESIVEQARFYDNLELSIHKIHDNKYIIEFFKKEDLED